MEQIEQNFLDLVTANIHSDNISIILGNGNGTFGPATNFPIAGALEPVNIAAGNFN